MLGELAHVLNATFIKYTGYECDDVSDKLAVLSLQHPAGMAIRGKFDQVRAIYEGSPELGVRPIREVLSWDTGRFGGGAAFIVDVIEGRTIRVRDVVRVMPDHVRSRRRNDCCGSNEATASMCPRCKVCFCNGCMRGEPTRLMRGLVPVEGYGEGWYRCACWLASK